MGASERHPIPTTTEQQPLPQQTAAEVTTISTLAIWFLILMLTIFGIGGLFL